MAETPDILKKILEYKREELAAAMAEVPLAEMVARVADMEDQPRGFIRALSDAAQSGWTPIIAEVKKKDRRARESSALISIQLP